ncbi:MAG: orotidine 5'-phosphate decarboxylase, partial [Candidatus Omnitrophica bacterium]|nr:orotidine 5'-phosphate decarboxylase [Candidatus Omnitrophota bacterium]
MKPILQVALDFVNLKRALKCAGEAVAGGVDWLEAGTPLIKSEGLSAVRELRRMFPRKTIVADMKIMDAGRVEVE